MLVHVDVAGFHDRAQATQPPVRSNTRFDHGRDHALWHRDAAIGVEGATGGGEHVAQSLAIKYVAQVAGVDGQGPRSPFAVGKQHDFDAVEFGPGKHHGALCVQRMVAVERLLHDAGAVDLPQRHTGAKRADRLRVAGADALAARRTRGGRQETLHRRLDDHQRDLRGPDTGVFHRRPHGIGGDVGMGEGTDFLRSERTAAGTADGKGAATRRGLRRRLVHIGEKIAKGRHRPFTAGRNQKSRTREQSLAAMCLDFQGGALQRIFARKIIDVGIAFGLDQQRKAADARWRKLAQLPGKIAGVARMGRVIGQYVYGHGGILVGCG